MARIGRHEGSPEKGYQVQLLGTERFEVSEYSDSQGFLLAHGQVFSDSQDESKDETIPPLFSNMKLLAGEILDLLPAQTDRLKTLVENMNDPSLLTYTVAQHLDIKLNKKQELLETRSLKARMLSLLEQMVASREELRLQREMNQKLSSRLGKQHRDAILREQIRTLQEELGEKNNEQNDYQTKIAESGMPEDVQKIAQEQWQRLEAMGPQSPEYHVIRNYLDLLMALPWSKQSQAEIDLNKAREILAADHYGLEPIKKRILQHLAVLKLKNKKGGILLFVGPPGVGKTSLGRSIAHAMGRKFVRVSLGGMRDDAEVRGHRRTYVGALPGRIIDGIKRAGENNPVFMLDEIDKMSRGWGGDPASSLLEVLDPEQNSKFLDHYLDVPFDLSNVFFIATANALDTIAPPLLDRMEIITLSGYTTAEKLHISKTHLLPKELAEHGVKNNQLDISESAQKQLIQFYTREAGVRELQRLLSNVIRASTEKVLNNTSNEPVRVTEVDLDELVGQEKFLPEPLAEQNQPGVVTGLAWTPMGGEILFVESSHIPGQGKLILTGQLGEVMKESAQIAMTLARSRLAHVVANFAADREDVHLHVPAGAIPKDGPSAGVAMLAAVASLLLNRPVNAKIAMTGEITLRGAVMPVGGIKEKVFAAHRAGIKKIVLPRRNERDLKDVPVEVKSDLKFVFAETVEEALYHVLGLEPQHWARSIPTELTTPTQPRYE